MLQTFSKRWRIFTEYTARDWNVFSENILKYIILSSIVLNYEIRMRATSIKLDEETIDELDTEADERDLTRSQYLRRIIDARHETQADAATTDFADIDERIDQLEARVDRLDESKQTETVSERATPALGERCDEESHDAQARHETDTDPLAHERTEATADDADSHTEREAIEAILHDWRPGRSLDKRERQREVGRAVIEWLRGQTVASASEFKAELESDHPVEGQSPQTWWKQTAREALKRAQERGLVEFVDGRKEWRWTG